MEYYLAKFTCWLGDEFEITGIRLVTNEDMDKLVQQLANVEYPVTPMLGNERVHRFKSFQDVLEYIDLIPITEGLYEAMGKMFSGYALKGFGLFPYVEGEDDDEFSLDNAT